MRHLKIYEQYIGAEATAEAPVIAGEKSPTEETPPTETKPHFEVESTDIISTKDNAEGNYKVNFKNADGEDTTIEIAGASKPEFMQDTMVSKIEMIPDSSSDGKTYSIMGYYDKMPDMPGEFELNKVLIEEI